MSQFDRSFILSINRGTGAIVPIPFLGVIIAALTIFGVSIQGAETVRAQIELEQKHTSVLKEIDQARNDAAKQHTEAMQEIAQARREGTRTIGQAVTIDEKIKEQFQQRKILQMLLRACNSDQIKLEVLRKSLSLPLVSKKIFCEYLHVKYG